MYVQPEFIFNSNRIEYRLEDLESGAIDAVFAEDYKYLDIPVMVGLKSGILRINAGPVAHVFLNSSSELWDIDGYEQKFDEMTWGWQAGLGLDLWMLTLDFRYEGNFNNAGDHFRLFGEKFQFDESPSRWIGSIGIRF